MEDAYKKIFYRVGIGEMTYLTFASGGSFSKYSHEFQTLTPAGEDTIYICEKCRVAVNDEIIEEQDSCPRCDMDKDTLKTERAIEVGNIFSLKTKFSDAFGLTYKDKEGAEKTVHMGCYGIGVGRLMGTVVEVLSDEKGLIWPEEIAPFSVHLLALSQEQDVKNQAEKIYDNMQEMLS